MPRGLTLVGLLLAMWVQGAPAQVATTQVVDTVYRANGTPAHGTVLVSWSAFTTAGGASVPAGSTSATLDGSGVLRVSLAPNAGAIPAGTYYTAVYHLDDGRTSREYWVVPVSTSAVTISSVRNSVLPVSTAMQTVSKQYVDQAIAAAVTGAPLDSATPYVLKAGDTMTGTLQLAGDPVGANDASDKHYVDVQVAGISAGLGQKVSTSPSATQTVVQPAGTTLATSSLNGTLHAQEFITPPGNNGISNALASSDCANGCQVNVEGTYTGTDLTAMQQMPSRTHVRDVRGGETKDYYFNPHSLAAGRPDTGQDIVSTVTEDAATQRALYGTTSAYSTGLHIQHTAPGGGNNVFPEDISVAPYFKSTYTGLSLEGVYNAAGQHVLDGQQVHCYGVGDCLLGGRVLLNSGGYRDNADEGAHAYDFIIQEDPTVFQGSCASGCTTGSTQIVVNATAGAGTSGEGRFLINTTPSKRIQAGTLIGGVPGVAPHPTAIFSGTSFPVSTFLRLNSAVLPQATNMAPGVVSVAIATSGLPSGFSTNTASLPGTSGVACISDNKPGGTQGGFNFETANYTVVDGTHVRVTFNKPHGSGATFAVGGLCGYGLEQTVDTVNGIRQVFPVVGSISTTQLYYASNVAAIVGGSNTTSAYWNTSSAISSIVRSGNVVTVTLAGSMDRDMNGLTITVAGVADSSFNGNFVVTTTSASSFTYSQVGSNATSSGGTAGYVTGGYVLYPAVEVLQVYNPASHAIDGTMKLAPNTVAWAAGDTVEQPHFYQQSEHLQPDFIQQTMPRMMFPSAGGMTYAGNAGPGLRGWMVRNEVPASSYFGNGGTHTPPDYAHYVTGIWTETMDAQAGERSVFSIHCNSHGCGNWNSTYNLFELDRSPSGYDAISFAPQTSTLAMNLRGTAYSFSPTAMTSPLLNATRLAVGPSVTASSSGTAVVAGSGLQTIEIHGTNPANKRSAFTFANNFGGVSQSAFEFGTDFPINGTADFYVYNYATARATMRALPTDDVVFSGKITAANFNGVLSGVTGSIGGSSLSAGSCASGTAAVSGAAVGQPVAVSASDGSLPNALVILSAAVTGANTVTVQACAVATVTPAAKTYNVRVIQ